ISRTRAWVTRLPAAGWMMIALIVGFAIGTFLTATSPVVDAARLIGGIWLDGLRMTIVPLIFALVATGVASLNIGDHAEAARLGRRLPLVLTGLLIVSAIIGAILSPLLLGSVSIAPADIAALRTAFPAAPAPEVPGTADAIRAMIPTNVVASAAEGAILPLVIFALVLGLAVGKIDRERAQAVIQPLQGLADAMIVVVGWVLRVAPIGIFALALAIGATVGTAVIAILAQYVAISITVTLVLIILGYAIARFAGRIPLGRFARAIAPAQAIAASTQSSIATLPAMMVSAERLGIDERDAAVILPMAVATFKITAPSNTLLMALALAWMAGVEVSPLQIAVALPLAVLSSLAILGMPGQISFYASVAPTAIALGAPIELLPILLAIDVIPDMVRTVANVTYDVAAAAAIAPPAAVDP
ncbi:MAG: cation:dicarboxylase symporter family transporter, partial [Sphingopyxis sp.]|nr:cation:dicarboxylase symporter family transporter [Sphingopyxis sp.]